MVQRHRCCGSGGYVVVDELRYGRWGDVVDEGEGGEEKNGRGTVLWGVRFVGGQWQIRGGEHEFLVCTKIVSASLG